MTIVCDTSPLCYLILIDQIDVMPQLFGRISIPKAVQNELIAEGASVQTWIAQAPDWLDIHVVSGEPDQMLERLDVGETEAILLAERLGSSLIVLDDLDARRIATQRGLTVTGLLGVLYQAGSRQIIDFPDTLERLQQTSFRASSTLLEQFLDRYRRGVDADG
ncbi:DUF3368 domain-containing protein [Coleofasciculus sp. F4-SAH-05]|uniref:DUF3368 domain-containing protein n=1 Tax=Coleofasciculus sp. F4-SAH-05 TaxID=3069525 RepID=UPI0032F807C6